MDDFAKPNPARPLAAYQPTPFFLARQPILNRSRKLVAYELLFRSTAHGPANVKNDRSATAAVMAHAAELGIHNVIGPMRGFINVDAEVLLSDLIGFLPRDRVVLEILETVEVTPRIVERVRELRRAGYAFALDDVIADSPNVEALLPWVEVIKVDLCGTPEDKLPALAERFRAAGKRLLAEKVEDATQFERCLALGFDYFQGFHFARPAVLQGERLLPSPHSLKEVLALTRAGASADEVEEAIKRDPSLGLTLVRLASRIRPDVPPGIASVGQALRQMRQQDLERWLQIVLYTEPDCAEEGAAPLLTLAATRARLLELLARHLRPHDPAAADTAFTVGMLSHAEALLGLPMAQVLEQFAVTDEVRRALLGHEGWLGELLALAQRSERGLDVDDRLQALGLQGDAFAHLQLQAFEWGDAVGCNTHPHEETL